MSMKNTHAMDLSKLATATRLELEVADTQGKLKYTKLPPARGRRAQQYYTSGVVRAGRGTGRPQKVG